MILPDSCLFTHHEECVSYIRNRVHLTLTLCTLKAQLYFLGSRRRSAVFSVFLLRLWGVGIYSFTSILGSPPQPFVMMCASVGFVWSLWFALQVFHFEKVKTDFDVFMVQSCTVGAHSTIKCSQRLTVRVCMNDF